MTRLSEGVGVGFRPPSVNAPNPAPTPPAAAPPSQPASHPGLPPAAATDPGVVAAQAARDAAIARANALLRQQRAQALIQFGDPSLLNGLGFGVDPSWLAAAKANQYSFVNQLHQADSDRRRAELNSEAARGILHSGETGYQSGQEDKWYGSTLYSAEQQLLANLNAYLGNYNASSDAAGANYDNALQNWWNNYSSHPPTQTGDPQTDAYIALRGLESPDPATRSAAGSWPDLNNLLSPTTILRALGG